MERASVCASSAGPPTPSLAAGRYAGRRSVSAWPVSGPRVLLGIIGLVLVVMVGPAVAVPSQALRVGGEPDYPPFSMLDEHGRPVGYAMDLVDALARVMDADITLRAGSWHALLEDLRAGRLDLLPFVGLSDARAAYLDFTVPIATTHGVVFVAEGGPVPRSEGELAALRIGVLREGIVHDRARGRPWGVALVPHPTLRLAFACLAERRCEAVVAPRLQGMTLLRRLGLSETIRPAGLVLDDFSLEYALAVRKGNHALLADLNGGLATLMTDGTLTRLNDLWLETTMPARGVPTPLVVGMAATGVAGFTAVLVVLVRRQRHLGEVAAQRHRDLHHERVRRRRADAEAAAILRVLPDIVLRLDADGRYVDCHDPEGMAMMPREHLLGRYLEEVLPAELAARVRAVMTRVAETGEVQTLDYDLTLPRGVGQRWFQARFAPFAEGGVVAVARDVSTARERSDQLTRAAAAIASASAAKSRFLATMSHELRTPLNAIIGFSQMMEAEVFGPVGAPEYRAYTRDIQAAGQTLLMLIAGIMDMAQVEAGRMTLIEADVDLGAVLAQRMALARPGAAETGTHVDMDPPDQPIIVRADAGLVQRMVENLVSNAVRFSPGGSVRLGARRLGTGGTEVWVADTGVGMTEDQLANLGEPFYQASPLVARPSGGFGLGVTLVREMIVLHGGELRYDSHPGEGTVARLLFPAARSVGDVAGGPHLRVVR